MAETINLVVNFQPNIPGDNKDNIDRQYVVVKVNNNPTPVMAGLYKITDKISNVFTVNANDTVTIVTANVDKLGNMSKFSEPLVFVAQALPVPATPTVTVQP